jgi:DNA recombination protein RmuC
MDIIWGIVGILVGGVAAWYLTRMRLNHDQGLSIHKIEELERRLEEAKTELIRERDRVIQLNADLSSSVTENSHLRQRMEEQNEDLQKLQEKFTKDFQLIANSILEEKSKKFTDHNKAQLSDLLNPLKEKIVDFEKKVEQTHRETLEKNSALREQIRGLKEINLQMSKEAENLTKALKGEAKTRGNWGEVILENILERSGLVRDREYILQQSITKDDGRRVQPDVLIKLPEGKTIIVDSKVSLVHYENFYNDEDELNREIHVKKHIESIRRHIKDLSGKSYQDLNLGKGLDFVLMFIPIEPAFGLAVQNDPDLFTDAYEKNIVIVSPSTLIATLRTIANIWKNEYQNRNAQKIAEESGKLYDKFVGFSNDLVEIGKKLNSTKISYDQAMTKLSTGAGNLIKRTEDIKKLGAKTSKSIDQKLIDRSTDN